MERKVKPAKLLLARAICRNLPPIVAQRVRELVYPRKAAYADNFEFSVKAVTGSEFRGTTQDHHGYPFSVHGYYEWRSWAIALSICSQGDTIIEVGANLGTETVGFSDIVGRNGKVFAFEPSPTNAEIVRRAARCFQFKNVLLSEKAVWDSNRKANFADPLTEKNSGCGHLKSNDKSEDNFNEIEVNCITLDSLIDKVKKVSFMHIDAEGSELMVLRGGRDLLDRDRPAIFLEASPKHAAKLNYNLKDLYRELSILNYQPYKVGKYDLYDIVDFSEKNNENWLCVHKTRRNILKVKNMIKRCGFLPCTAYFNPLFNIAHR